MSDDEYCKIYEKTLEKKLKKHDCSVIISIYLVKQTNLCPIIYLWWSLK